MVFSLLITVFRCPSAAFFPDGEGDDKKTEQEGACLRVFVCSPSINVASQLYTSVRIVFNKN